MAFTRPTLTELVDRIQQDFLSRLALVAPILRRAMVYVFSRVVAGAAHMLHGHLEYLAKQILPDLSDREYLLRQAALFDIQLKTAVFASGNVTVTGTDGSVVDLGAILLRSDGTQYETVSTATIAGGVATVAVFAVLAGADPNCAAGVVLTFQSPIAGVNSSATVATGGLAGGSDEETTDSLRARFLERMRSPPNGGSEADYVAWALAVAGVTRAWCYPLELGAGTVVVRFVRDDDAGSIIPDSGEVAAVQTYIAARRPVTAAVTVAAPTGVPLNYTIALTPSTTATRAAVEAELQDMLRRDAQPGGTILRSQIDVAVGIAEGVTNFVITAPAADVAHATGQMATHGTITWV